MTNAEAIKYAKEIHFCTGCPIDMSIDGNSKHCDTCEHRQFFEMAIEALEKDSLYGDCDGCDYSGSCDDCLRWDKHADCYEVSK